MRLNDVSAFLPSLYRRLLIHIAWLRVLLQYCWARLRQSDKRNRKDDILLQHDLYQNGHLQIRSSSQCPRADRELPGIIPLGPNSVLPRRQDTLGIQGILDGSVEMHLRIIVEIVRLRNLIHQRQMRPILSPSPLCRIVNQLADQPVGSAARVWVLAVED